MRYHHRSLAMAALCGGFAVATSSQAQTSVSLTETPDIVVAASRRVPGMLKSVLAIAILRQ